MSTRKTVRITRLSKSFTIEPDVDDYIARTRGVSSASERVNELLRTAMIQERYQRLEREAAEFFAKRSAEERRGAKAWQKASSRAVVRD